MTPEELAQLTDSIARLEVTVNNLATGIETLNVLTPRFGGSMRGANIDLDKMREMARKTGETLEEYTARLEEVTALQIAQAKAEEQAAQATENVKDAMYSLKTGMNQFKEAILSTERTLGKYSGTLDNAGDAAIDLGKNFGLAGVAAGVAIKGFTTLASAGLKQADAQLKATDALAKVGATGTLTTDQVLDMGHAAGLTSKNLELFTKPLQSMGTSLITLGGTTREAVKEFANMTAIRKEERQAFQRLGISQEELIQNQADYVKLQQASGVQITDSMKKNGRLQAASLEYTENLLKLSAITGKNVDEVKKDQEIARAGYATLIQTNKLNRQINEAEALGLTDRANALRAERDARNKLLDTIQSQVGDPALLAGVQEFLATGAITELSQSLLQLNIPIQQFSQRIKNGEDVTADFMESLKKGVDAREEQMGFSLALSEQTGKIMGVTTETLLARARMGERDEKDIRQRTAAEIAAGKKEGLDGIKDVRATMTEAEIVLQKGIDNIVQTLNPLQMGFGFAAAAAGALAMAAYAATAALTRMSTASVAGDVIDGASGRGGLGKLGSLVKGGTTLAKFGGLAAGVVSVGSGIMTAMDGSKAADQAVAEGTMTKVQGEQAKEEAKYTGGGEAVGGVIGGALGMLAGPLGAAIGGTIGSKLGGFIGGWVARRDDEEKLAEDKEVALTAEATPAGPPPTLADLRDAQRLATEQKDQTAALKAFNERLKNVQASGTVLNQAVDSGQQAQPVLPNVASELGVDSGQQAQPVVPSIAPALETALPVAAASQTTAALQGFNANDYPEQLQKYINEEMEKSGFDDARARAKAKTIAELRLQQDVASGVVTPAGTTTIKDAVPTVKPAETPEYKFDELTSNEIEKAARIYKSMGMNPENILTSSYFDRASLETRKELFDTLRKDQGYTTKAADSIQQIETPNAEDQKQKSWFERNKNTISGMALGILGGPLGIMAGGLIGRTLDTKLEEKQEDIKPADALKQDKDEKLSDESSRLSTNFRNLSTSLDIFSRNVTTLDKNFDEINFGLEEMVGDLTGEGDIRSPAETMANDFKNNLAVAMIDLRRLANRAVVSSGDTQSKEPSGTSAQTGPGAAPSTATPAATAEPNLASAAPTTRGMSASGTEPGGSSAESGVSIPDFAQGKPGAEKPIAKVVDAGPGFTTVQTEDGSVQKREGVRNWRNNNPGNLEFGRYAKSKDAVGTDGRFAVFPTLEDGMEAKRDLIFGNRYIDLSIAQAISKYAPPHENDTNMYIRQIMEATGANSQTLLKELSGSQRESMLSAINRVEGFKPGKIIEGSMGGIASGPKSGYPALLHGREAIVPLATNSLLEKMAKTPETQPIQTAATITTTQTVDSPALNKSVQDLVALNADMMSMMQEKLDEMIDKLGAGNDINKKIYKTALA